jgi:hypothetical protein
VVEFDRHRFRHRGESRPVGNEYENQGRCVRVEKYLHGRVESTSNLIVLVESRTASENLWKPKLADSTLHVANLALSRRRCFHPLCRLSSNTTYHVSMSECLWRSLDGLDIESRGDWLGDA